MTIRKHQVITIPGDGIGKEVIPAAVSVLNKTGEKFGFQIDWNEVPWGSDYFIKHKRMMPVDSIEIMSKYDAILLGAVGVPDVSDIETLWGLLIPIRKNFDQYINLRPIKSFRGVKTPLAGDKQIDMLIIRENAEGEYSKVGGRYYEGFAEETALQVSVFTRRGIERVTSYAVEQAKLRKKKIVSATKSNGIIYSMPFWDEVVASVVMRETDIELKSILIDALAAALVLHPEDFDVIVASNLFGDIISDLVAALVGSIGIAASGNINPERKFPSMFEPVHGSAPDIMGKGIANPVGAIQAGSLMLKHLGELDAADEIDSVLHNLIATGISTADLGGTENTNSFTLKLTSVIG